VVANDGNMIAEDLEMGAQIIYVVTMDSEVVAKGVTWFAKWLLRV